jgi:hypothetical protein
MLDEPINPEAAEFEKRFRAVLEGFDRPRRLRGVFLDTMIEIEVIADQLLCELLRIQPEQVELVRSTVLAVPFRSKIESLKALLTDAGVDNAVVGNLESLWALRNVLAHAQATRPGAKLFDTREPLVFLRYGNGKTKPFEITEDELAERQKDAGAVWNELNTTREALWQKRGLTTFVHVTAVSGRQFWDVRQASPDDVPEEFRDAMFPPQADGSTGAE